MLVVPDDTEPKSGEPKDNLCGLGIDTDQPLP